jgi:hypothetical protein
VLRSSALVTDRAHLERLLTAWCPSVLPRGAGRTKQQTEPWVSRRFLLAALHFDVLRFPLTPKVGERPDLLLSVPRATLGVEITETVPPCLAQADAIAQQYYPNAVVDRSIFKWGAEFTPQEIHAHLARANKLTGPGWMGDSVEREFAVAASETICAKTISLNKPGYGAADSYWLVAYTSSPGPALDIRAAAEFLPPLPRAVEGKAFEAAFLLTDRAAVHLTHSGVVAVAETVPDPSNYALERTRGV